MLEKDLKKGSKEFIREIKTYCGHPTINLVLEILDECEDEKHFWTEIERELEGHIEDTELALKIVRKY